MAKEKRKEVPPYQLQMKERVRLRMAREALPGLWPDEVARRSHMRRLKKSIHTITRNVGSPAKHVKRLHPRKGE